MKLGQRGRDSLELAGRILERELAGSSRGSGAAVATVAPP